MIYVIIDMANQNSCLTKEVANHGLETVHLSPQSIPQNIAKYNSKITLFLPSNAKQGPLPSI